MHPVVSAPFRVASPDELARLATARRSLGRAAMWARFLAVYMPGGIGVVVVVATLQNYPGDLPLRVLIGSLQLLALGAVFTVPILLSGTGRTLALHRKLERDVEAGFGVTREVGEVTWGKRERAYVAKVRGERLFSPFFTELVSVPAFWSHFDELAPGTYAFELLPESRLVLTAQAVERARLGADANLDTALGSNEAPGRLALRTAFGNAELELDANREGRASLSQRLRLVLSHWWAFLGVAMLGAALGLEALNPRDSWAWKNVASVIVGVGFIAFLTLLVVRVLWDALEGRVDTLVGSVSIRRGKTDSTGTIGTTRFTLSNAKARALSRGRSYRVFVFRHSRVAAGVEPTQTERGW
jgi:hypothetical protein